jgi:hypothetical protein
MVSEHAASSIHLLISTDDTGGKTENKRDRKRRMIHERLTKIYSTFIDSRER